MSTSAPDPQRTGAFDKYTDSPRWVGWRGEPRPDDPSKTTKVPYSPTRRGKAKANDPTTWGTRAQAEVLEKRIVNGQGGGVGIELGDLGDGTSLGGIDLDTCLDANGAFDPWATEIINKYGSYAEVSPSRTGAKIFFLYSAEDLPAIRAAMGGAMHGRSFKRPGDRGHPPGIEVHVSNRYFTVTLERLPQTPDEIRVVELKDIVWVLTEAGPRFARSGGNSSSSNDPLAGGAPPRAAGRRGPNLIAAARSGVTPDHSRSGVAFRIARDMHRDEKTFDDFCEAVRTDPETESWYTDKCTADNDRQLHRAWDRAGTDNPYDDDASDAGINNDDADINNNDTGTNHCDTSTNNNDINKNNDGASTNIGNTGTNDRSWRRKLRLSAKKLPLPILANAIAAARDAPPFRGIAYDEFRLRTVIRGEAPWPHLPGADWTDAHDVCAAEWLQHNGIQVSADIAAQAVEKAARERPFHPVRDYLNGLLWDGTPRLDSWVCDYLGAARTAYHRAAGAKSLIGAVARPFEPGCKVDNVLILEGAQDLGKSSSIRTLAGPPWFSDDIKDLGTKDAAMQISGVWIMELAELSSLTSSEVSAVKAFATRQTDRFRPPYGRRVIEQPRHGVLWGTSNKSVYLRDETGGRRWWPVRCTCIDIPKLAQVRDQLWAEAVHRYRAGEHWWLEDPKLKRAAKGEQAARYQQDPWRESIEEFVTGQLSVTVGEVLRAALWKEEKTWTRNDETRVSECLVTLGWGRTRIIRTPGRKQEWCYVPPGHKSHPDRPKRRRM